MSKPRPVRPGETCVTQKQCLRQEARLVPDADATQVLLYALAYFVAKFQMQLHEFSYSSNQESLEVTDGKATRPQFLAALHSLVARALNSKYGDCDALWSSKPYAAPVLHDQDSKIENAVGILTNVVDAELVRFVWDWPGATSYSMEYDKPIRIRKPGFFFSKDMPDEVDLVIRRPPHTRPDLDDRALRVLIRQRVRQRQGAIALAMRVEGRAFLGKKRVLRLDRDSRPFRQPMREPIHPLVATRNAKLRLAALRRNARFLNKHQIARRARSGGDATAVFPFGTYLARVRDGAPCHGSDP